MDCRPHRQDEWSGYGCNWCVRGSRGRISASQSREVSVSRWPAVVSSRPTMESTSAVSSLLPVQHTQKWRGGRERDKVEQVLEVTARVTNLFNEHVSLCHLAAGCEGVLHNPHDRPVALGGHDIPRDHQQLLNFGLCFEALGDVEIHLVSIEISIVRCSHTV